MGRKAARFRMGVEEAMRVAPAVPPYIARSLQQLDERLNELKQWKDYASRFGMTPSDRAKLTTGNPEDVDPAAEFIA